LRSAAEVIVSDRSVLCHGDPGLPHIFVDSDMRVSGLIDWGMWHAGSAAGDLASVATIHAEAAFAAVLAGHGESSTDPELRQAILCCTVAQLVGQTSWLIRSEQTALLPDSAVKIRQALADLSN
jgi:aminoglycoside phosphotransferase (APT) family kinase protein